MFKETEIYKYFRTLNRIIPRDRLVLDRFGNRDVFISVTDTSYYIFDVEKFDILFVGPYIPKIRASLFHRDTLYISTGESIKKYKRANCIGEIEKDDVREMLGVGEFLLVVDSTGECTLVDSGQQNNTSLHTLPYSVSLLHHPHTYVNKVVIVQKDSSILYNFIKKKEVYKFKSLKKDILLIRDSRVVDVVGVGYEDKVEIVDLKKDKVLYIFPIRGIPTEIDFSSTRLLVVAGGALYLFDLEDKRLVLKKSHTLHCRFLDETYLLHTSPECISILDSDLKTIKRMPNCTRGILGVETLSGNDSNSFFVYSRGEIYKYNTGNTSSYTKYKFSGEIEKVSFSEGVGIIYGRNILYRLGTSIKEILATEVSHLASHRNTTAILTGNTLSVLYMRNVYRTIEINQPVKDIKMDSKYIYLLLTNKLRIISYQSQAGGEVEYTLMGDTEYHTLHLHESFILLSTPRSISLFVKGKVCRVFPSTEDILSVDVSRWSVYKWLVYNTKSSIFVFDILSGDLLDTIPLSSKVVRFSQDMLFLIVVTTSDDLLLLNNKLMFTPKRQAPCLTEYRRVNQEGFLKASKKQNKLVNELLLQRTLGENELFSLEDSEFFSLEKQSFILNSLLKEKSMKSIQSDGVISDSQIERLLEKYSEIFKKFEENYLKTVGYLELENDKLI